MGASLLDAGDELNGDAWGLHDGVWVRTRVDWRARMLELDLELAVSTRQKLLRPATFVVEGLVFFVTEPPHPRREGEAYWDFRGDMIDVRDVSAAMHERAGLPPLPAGAWCCYVWDNGANTTAYVAGHHCDGRWTGEPFSTRSNVFFPGETVPIPPPSKD